MRSLATICLSAVFALSAATGCATEPGTEGPAESTGTVQLPLITSGSDGAQYRLSAAFEVSTAGGVVQAIDASQDVPTVSVDLVPGSYRIRLVEGFQLQRSISGGPFQPVPATLASSNPISVEVSAGVASSASYNFLVPAINGTGTLTIFFGVITQEAQIAGSLIVDFANGALSPYAGSLIGFTVPYSLSGVNRFNPGAPTFSRGSSFVGMSVTDLIPNGPLTGFAGQVSGTFLSYSVQIQSDGTQFLSLQLGAPTSSNPRFPLLVANGLISPLPVDEFGFPVDPRSVGLRVTLPFFLTLDNNVAGAPDNLQGTVDLQF